MHAETKSPADDARPALRLHGLSKRYGSAAPVLAGIDLDIAPHSFVSLLGPSGCGKSTLLRLVAGLTAPSGGGIEWPRGAGRDARVSFVFQEPTLMPWATAARNVALPLRLQGLTAREARARATEALAAVGLAGAADAYPRELSGGMKMRVSIARALVTQPELLLMDEPFAALDEITRQKLSDDLLRLWQAQRFTTLFVTHSVFESVFLAQRILVMAPRPGRISADLAVGEPYPRTPAYRTSAPYAEHSRRASDALAATLRDAEVAA
ncbi:ABC transporter ATP-binding protein [Solimonas marina]|uniref:ABC transporter ATP-binding protein n=1 Tax=Solimonas marina TaxID=2714601 RepID=A0A969WH80_9GAMM|nr:ABC transporter ATP-binding protein [Solimonas marina]NKF24630.1 ABC transporter ATP-binding protein [Solimonas marina]